MAAGVSSLETFKKIWILEDHLTKDKTKKIIDTLHSRLIILVTNLFVSKCPPKVDKKATSIFYRLKATNFIKKNFDTIFDPKIESLLDEASKDAYSNQKFQNLCLRIERVYTTIFYGFEHCFNHSKFDEEEFEGLCQQGPVFQYFLDIKDLKDTFDDSIFINEPATSEVLEEPSLDGLNEKESKRLQNLDRIEILSQDIDTLTSQNQVLQKKLKELEDQIEPLQTKKSKGRLPIEKRPLLKRLLEDKSKNCSQIKDIERQKADLEAEKQKLIIRVQLK